MNSDVKIQWITALRSGDYQQGRNRLRDGEKFCCLGVLCDLAAKAGVGAWVTSTYTGIDGVTVQENAFDGGGCCPTDEVENGNCDGAGETAFLPHGVQNWANTHQDPCVTVTSTEVTSLAGLNDGGLTFTQIADLIETFL